MINSSSFHRWRFARNPLHRLTYNYAFSSFSLLYRSSSFRNCPFGFITLGRSPRHFGQNHFPFGFVVSETHEKWNHSMGHRSLSQSIISPKEIWSQRQQRGSSGSIGSVSSGGVSERCAVWRALRFFFLPIPEGRGVGYISTTAPISIVIMYGNFYYSFFVVAGSFWLAIYHGTDLSIRYTQISKLYYLSQNQTFCSLIFIKTKICKFIAICARLYSSLALRKTDSHLSSSIMFPYLSFAWWSQCGVRAARCPSHLSQPRLCRRWRPCASAADASTIARLDKTGICIIKRVLSRYFYRPPLPNVSMALQPS